MSWELQLDLWACPRGEDGEEEDRQDATHSRARDGLSWTLEEVVAGDRPRGNDNNNSSMCGVLNVMPGPALNTVSILTHLNLTKPMRRVHPDTPFTNGKSEAQSLRNSPKVTQLKSDRAKIPTRTVSPSPPTPVA